MAKLGPDTHVLFDGKVKIYLRPKANILKQRSAALGACGEATAPNAGSTSCGSSSHEHQEMASD
jgi:hypothetical protein